MSTAQFPTLAGQGWSITRSPIWNTEKQDAKSGKQTRIGYWSYPKYQWKVVFNLLRQGFFTGQTFAEFSQLMGFFNERSGALDSFLYQDQDDNAVVGQQIGVTDGVNTGFQAVRTFGGYTEPVFAINAITALSVGGTVITAPFSFNPWGYTGTAGGPGYIFLPSIVAAGQPIVASFSYFFPCSFDEDQAPFEKFAANQYSLKELTFTSIK